MGGLNRRAQERTDRLILELVKDEKKNCNVASVSRVSFFYVSESILVTSSSPFLLSHSP